jgi:lipopolysaccharide assembly protein A
MSSAPAHGDADATRHGPQPPQEAPRQGHPAAGVPPQHKVNRTRIGGVWIASALFALVLLLLLIFILQNGTRVQISYLGAHGRLPLGVALLLAAVLGVLLVVIPGTGRIIQLRMTARRHGRLDAAAVAAESASSQGAAAIQPGNSEPEPPAPGS